MSQDTSPEVAFIQGLPETLSVDQVLQRAEHAGLKLSRAKVIWVRARMKQAQLDAGVPRAQPSTEPVAVPASGAMVVPEAERIQAATGRGSKAAKPIGAFPTLRAFVASFPDNTPRNLIVAAAAELGVQVEPHAVSLARSSQHKRKAAPVAPAEAPRQRAEPERKAVATGPAFSRARAIGPFPTVRAFVLSFPVQTPPKVIVAAAAALGATIDKVSVARVRHRERKAAEQARRVEATVDAPEHAVVGPEPDLTDEDRRVAHLVFELGAARVVEILERMRAVWA